MKRSQVYNIKSMKWKKGIKEMELPILQSGFVGLCDSCLTTSKNAKEELEKVKKEYEEKGWKMISSSPINGRYKVTFQIVK